MQKITLFKKLIALSCLLLSINCAIAQNPLWNIAPNYWPVPGPGALSLPAPGGTYGYDGTSQGYTDNFQNLHTLPPVPNGPGYHSGPYNMYKDKSGKPLFFIIGGVVFNSQGYLIDTLYTTTSTGQHIFASGWSEMCVVPNPANCTQYFLFTSCYNDSNNYLAGSGQYKPAFMPLYAMIDVSAANPYVSGQLGKNVTSSYTTLYPHSNLAYIYALTHSIPYTATWGEPISYSATKVRSDGSRFVFMQAGGYLCVLKISSSGVVSSLNEYPVTTSFPTSPHSCVATPFYGGFAGMKAELEVYEDSTNNRYRVALAGVAGAVGSQVGVFDFNMSTGVPTTTSFHGVLLGECSPCVIQHNVGITGLEFSPDGKWLYIVHEPNVYWNCSIEAVRFDSSSFCSSGSNSDRIYISSDSAFATSQIEIGTNGDLYLLKNTGSTTCTMYKITSPNSPSPSNLSSSGLSISSYPQQATPYEIIPPSGFFPPNIYFLPDQIDKEVYGSQFSSPTACCLFYSSYDRQTYYAGTQTGWTANTATWTANTIAGSYQNNPLTLTTSSSITIGEELRIPAGYTVTINNMTLKFSPQARLIIESGTSSKHAGALILNNDTLKADNQCLTDMWPGVQVWGAPSSAHGSIYQGYLFMNNSQIQDAYTAVLAGFDTTDWFSTITPKPLAPVIPSGHLPYTYTTTGTPFGGDGGGGMVYITSSTFLNNMQSLVMYDYNPSSNLNGNYAYQTNFLNTSLLLHTSVALQNFIYLYDHVNNFTLKGCSLNVVYTGHRNLTTGIWSNNSTYFVDQYSSTAPTTFSNLQYGIQGYDDPGVTATISCKNSTFNSNNYGAYLDAINNAIIENDTFKILNGTHASQEYGLYLDNCTGYYVQDNNFTRFTTGSRQLYGIVVNNSGAHANGIFRNTFNNLYKGSQAQYRNYVASVQAKNGTGLIYLCNIFSSGTISSADIYVPQLGSATNVGTNPGTDTAGVGYLQGTGGSATGGDRSTGDNQFSHTSGGKDFWIESGKSFPSNYFYWASTGNCAVTSNLYMPVTTNSVYVYCDPSATTPDCSTGGNGHARTMQVNPITQATDDAAAYKQLYDSLISSIDGGNTNDLLNLVAGNNNPSAVYSSLNATAPYISNAVLKAYINSNYPTSDINNILTACSPLNSEIQNALAASNLSAGIKSQVNALQTGTAKIDNLYNRISSAFTFRQLSLDEAIRILVRIADADTVIMTKALMKEQAMELPARVQVQTGIDIHDSAMAANALAQVTNAEGQSNYVKLHTILLQNLGTSAKSLMKNPSILNTVQAMATDSSDRLTYLRANNLLNAVGLSKYIPYIIPDNNTNTQNEERQAQQQSTTIVTSASTLINSPNPFKESTTVKAVIVEKTQNAFIVITDMVGNEIARYPVQQGENNINVSASGLNQAVMFCTLVVDGVKIKTNKMVLIK